MSEEKKLLASSSPHIKTEEDTRAIMLDVSIALLPALAIAVFNFGWRALSVTAVSVSSSVFFEWLYRRLLKKPSAVRDLSAVVTGLLLAYNLPVTVSLWLPVIGAAFAVVIVKQLYGGIGKNFMNPALAARAALAAIAPAAMTRFIAPIEWGGAGLPLFKTPGASASLDVLTSATPLAFMKTGALPEGLSLTQALLGRMGGCLGETSALCLLAGGAYLLYRRVITLRIPLAYLGTVALLTFLFPKGDSALLWCAHQLLSGGLMLGAIFMATDYSSSPVTKRGQILFGVGCGLITVFIRYFGAYAEGVSYSILIMNATVWMIDKSTHPRKFGAVRGAKGG